MKKKSGRRSEEKNNRKNKQGAYRPSDQNRFFFLRGFFLAAGSTCRALSLLCLSACRHWVKACGGLQRRPARWRQWKEREKKRERGKRLLGRTRDELNKKKSFFQLIVGREPSHTQTQCSVKLLFTARAAAWSKEERKKIPLLLFMNTKVYVRKKRQQLFVGEN